LENTGAKAADRVLNLIEKSKLPFPFVWAAPDPVDWVGKNTMLPTVESAT